MTERAMAHRETPKSVLAHLEPRVKEIQRELSELTEQENNLPAERRGSVEHKQIKLRQRKLASELEQIETNLRRRGPAETR